jgi:hypothetical protein
MSTRAGVGYSEDVDTEAAGREAAQAALRMIGGETADLAFLFSTYKHDQARLLRGVRAVLGDRSKIVGGRASGIITNDRLGYEGSQVGVALIRSDTVRVQTFVEPGLVEGEEGVGHRLGQQVRRSVEGEPRLILMYESVKTRTASGPLLNMGTPLLEGMQAALGEWPPTVGLALHGDPQWKPGLQYFHDRLEEQSAIAVALSGGVRMDTVTITNLKPMSTYRRATKVDGAALLEIDGKPALDAIAELVPGLSAEEYPLSVTLGVNRGSKFGGFQEESYTVHLCVAVDLERRALIIDNRLEAGVELQLMRRQIDLGDVRRRAAELLDRVRHRRPFLALYIDCAGRTSLYASTDREEAAEVQEVFGREVPLFGMYSGGEIGCVGGKVQRLTNAGVLAVLSE